MAKSEMSQKAAAKSKAAVTQPKAKAGSLSQERIDDSDSETEVKSPSKSKATTKTSSQKSNGAAVPLRPFSAPKKANEKPATKSAKTAAKSAPPVTKVDTEEESGDSSEEEEDESKESEEEEDADEELPDAPAAAAPTTNGVKRKADTQPAGASAKRVKADSTTETSEDSSDADDDSEEDDSDEKEEQPAESSKAAAPPTPSATKSKSATQSIPAKPYKPPAGYTLLESTQSPAVTSLLGSRSLTADKQIWHITAPADLPLSSLTTLTLDAIKSGKPVLQHDKVDYVLVDHHSASSTSGATGSAHLLVPNDAGTCYTFAAQPLARSLHLQPKIVLPNLSKRQADPDKGGHVAADISQAPIMALRPQPAGLRMRWKPPGFGNGQPGRVGIDGDSDGDEEGGAAVQFPRTLGAHAGASLPTSKVVDASPAKKSKKKKEKAAEAATQEENGEVKESKEEKAKRKEEKRMKEAKRKAAEAAA